MKLTIYFIFLSFSLFVKETTTYAIFHIGRSLDNHIGRHLINPKDEKPHHRRSNASVDLNLPAGEKRVANKNSEVPNSEVPSPASKKQKPSGHRFRM